MYTPFIRCLVVIMTLCVSPVILADTDDYQRQSEGEEKARAINEAIVPLVGLLFNNNRPHQEIYWDNRYAPNYGPQPYNPANPNLRMFEPGKCFLQRDGGPIREVTCR